MKVRLPIYKLHFLAPLHLGDERNDYSVSLKTIRSDTLYAALISGLSKIQEKIPDSGDLDFTISSLYPFCQQEKESTALLFFPKSLLPCAPAKEDLNYAKRLKNVTWLDKTYFEKSIQGENIFGRGLDISHINDQFLSSAAFDEDFMSTQIAPRVSVSRIGEDATPFYMERLFFKEHSGLYFFVDGNTEMLDKALNILQYEGIGTDRNIGNGFFTYSRSEVELTLPESEYSMSLSLFCPESNEQLSQMINDDHVAYDIIKRGGWITSPKYSTYRKNSIYMFSEGSVFKTDKVSKPFIKGRNVNLAPDIPFNKIDHPVYRNGKSIFIPILPS